MRTLKAVTICAFVALVRSTSYSEQFKMSQICESSAFPRSFSYHGAVSSDIECGSICARYIGCVSFSYVATNSTCMLNDGYVTTNNTCKSGIHYGVKLKQQTCTEPSGNVRLCNGTLKGQAHPNRGRVEILYNGIWGSVCDDGWESYNHGNMNAKVVCGMFGYLNGVANISATFGQSTGPIYLDDVVCTGTEASIMDCFHETVGVNNCSHGEDVGVICS